jgi:hypothetical protein
LQSGNLAKAVGSLRKHENTAIKDLARDLVAKWKDLCGVSQAKPVKSSKTDKKSDPGPTPAASAKSGGVFFELACVPLGGVVTHCLVTFVLVCAGSSSTKASLAAAASSSSALRDQTKAMLLKAMKKHMAAETEADFVVDACNRLEAEIWSANSTSVSVRVSSVDDGVDWAHTNLLSSPFCTGRATPRNSKRCTVCLTRIRT